MAVIIDNYIRLTVRDCKRLGYFVPKGKAAGVVRWEQGTEEIASIRFGTNLTGAVPYAVFDYSYKGTPVHTEITLRFHPSNLNGKAGYYYFVCPVTGLSCRNLYLVEGRFVSRAAFRPLYRTQAETKTPLNNISLAALRALTEYENLTTAKYRRLTYRGKTTPYGRKVEKLGERVEVLCEQFKRRVETFGWERI